MEEAEEPVVALHQVQHLVGRGAIAGGLADGTYEGVGHALADAFGNVTRLADHEEQALQVGVVLLGETLEHLVEPITRVGDHHHSHDGRGELAGGFHGDSRLLRGNRGVGPRHRGDRCDNVRNCLQKLAECAIQYT